MLVFKNKLWVIAGSDGHFVNDIWSSSDGISWTEVSNSTPFEKRWFHQSVIFDNKLWVIGGSGDSEGLPGTMVGYYKNDVWYTKNGIGWYRATSDAEFSKRIYHKSVAFNNRLWVIGGFDEDTVRKNDVWSSVDGRAWRLGYRGEIQSESIASDID